MKLIKFISALYLLCLPSSAFGIFETLYFDDIRGEEEGFASPRLANAIAIHPSQQPFDQKPLDQEEVEALLTSPHLKNLRTLDLNNQKVVNNEMINKLCQNKTLARLIRLDLSNTNITEEALHQLLENPYLGSLRDLPQISGRYGIPASTLYIQINNLPLDDQLIKQFNGGTLRNKDFTIHYRHPEFGTMTAAPARGIKLLELRSY